jgi:hypothetical protein
MTSMVRERVSPLASCIRLLMVATVIGRLIMDIKWSDCQHGMKTMVAATICRSIVDSDYCCHRTHTNVLVAGFKSGCATQEIEKMAFEF